MKKTSLKKNFNITSLVLLILFLLSSSVSFICYKCQYGVTPKTAPYVPPMKDHQICSDGLGNAIITWEHESNDYTIYTQKISYNGILEWGENGTLINSISKLQNYPKIFKDGMGGAFITWTDTRGSGTQVYDPYIQKVNSIGEPQYVGEGGQGTSVIVGNLQFSSPEGCVDGTGGAIITWDDITNSVTQDYNIKVQRMNSAGNRQWQGAGVEICMQPEYQRKPKICSDGAGGAFIAWMDNRDNDYD